MSTKTYEPIAAQTVAFLGLGVMGAPMAGHLARAGHRVTVYNRSAARAEAWLARHDGLDVAMAESPADRRSRGPARRAGARRAGLGRAGRGREWPAVDHVRRIRRGDGRGAPG